MIRNTPASPELKFKFEVICPNECRLPKAQWLKLLARSIDIPYGRALRFWRDGRAQIEGWEDERIEEAFLEKSLRKQTELQKKTEYQKYISREIFNEKHNTGNTSCAPDLGGGINT